MAVQTLTVVGTLQTDVIVFVNGIAYVSNRSQGVTHTALTKIVSWENNPRDHATTPGTGHVIDTALDEIYIDLGPLV